jgi:hypothetical protein
MEQLVGGLLYLGAILTTLAVLGATPVVLLWLGVEYCRGKRSARSMLIALCFPAAYAIGGIIGWTFRPFHWNMSFIETLRAQTADHSIEYYAERVLLFVLMTGSMGVWAVGIGMAAWTKWCNRHSPQIP